MQEPGRAAPMDQRRNYKDGLALAQLAPGPLAAQMAIYLGFVDFGVIGATLVGIIVGVAAIIG